jgi:hypothetical protein
MKTAKKELDEELLWYAVKNAVIPNLLVSNLAEMMRVSSSDVEALLLENGFGDLLAHQAINTKDNNLTREEDVIELRPFDFPDSYESLLSVDFSPELSSPLNVSTAVKRAFTLLSSSIVESSSNDPFASLYRNNVLEYHDEFLRRDAVQIDNYIKSKFGDVFPRYIVNSGIGANEQFNHFVSILNNKYDGKKLDWIIVDSSRHLYKLPSDAVAENTLFMEFSRSGKTEETVKIHEFTSRNAARIVFANSGPLRELGERDGNLILDLPDQVSGRFGRNKTPILLAPMYVAGLDTRKYWMKIDEAINLFNLSSKDNLPLRIAQFIYMYQIKNSINHIYFGCNDDLLSFSADEFIQFWNEGVNKNQNDISMSKYMGLLRDSHANIEGILSNHNTKLGIFLLRNDWRSFSLPSMTHTLIDPINLDHIGLEYGDDEFVLAEANYLRFSDLMPSIKIMVKGELSLAHSAVLGQLWADITYCYSKLMNVDPGSNPEVKFVRDRSSKLLAEFSERKKNEN